MRGINSSTYQALSQGKRKSLPTTIIEKSGLAGIKILKIPKNILILNSHVGTVTHLLKSTRTWRSQTESHDNLQKDMEVINDLDNFPDDFVILFDLRHDFPEHFTSRYVSLQA